MCITTRRIDEVKTTDGVDCRIYCVVLYLPHVCTQHTRIPTGIYANQHLTRSVCIFCWFGSDCVLLGVMRAMYKMTHHICNTEPSNIAKVEKHIQWTDTGTGMKSPTVTFMLIKKQKHFSPFPIKPHVT